MNVLCLGSNLPLFTMEVLWNQINLQRPPYRSWDISDRKFDSTRFIKSIDKILNDFQNFKIMHAEAALLSRLIYRMKSKFRSDKGLKHMEKVNRALLNYLNMSLEREYELLKEYVETNNGIISLPPQQTLEYTLVRTQGFAKLMSRVESTAMTAANFFKIRLHIGQAWTVSMIAYSVVSRIWILSRQLIKKSCIWYESIYKYMQSFKQVGIPWLPDTYVLPENLANWLNLPWFEENFENFPVEGKWDKSIFDLIQTGNTLEKCSPIEDLIAENFKIEKEHDVMQANISIPKSEDIDCGVPVSRESFEQQDEISSKASKKKLKKPKNMQNQNSEAKSSLLDINSEKDIIHFLKANSCQGFDKLQWNILQKRLKKFVFKITKNNTCDLDEQLIKKINRRIKKWTNST